MGLGFITIGLETFPPTERQKGTRPATNMGNIKPRLKSIEMKWVNKIALTVAATRRFIRLGCLAESDVRPGLLGLCVDLRAVDWILGE